jgi:cytochrome c-type biogenesis protein CcmH
MIVRCLSSIILLLLMSTAAFGQGTGAPDAAAVVGKPEGAPRTGSLLDSETKKIAALLRCPVCQGLSVNDSPASMAVNMKKQVRELVAAGFSQRQILEYFEKSYGEFVLLEPPRRGVNWLVWIAPLLGFLVGAWIIRSVLRSTPVPEAEPSEASSAVDPELIPYLERVRAIAYGSKEGKA